jgi:hypothetical protein
MSQRFFGVSAALLTVVFSVDAQPPSFQGPTAGYVYSRGARTIRPLFGIPGSSYLGSPVLQDVNSASISPGGEWAFVTNHSGSHFVRSLTEITPEAAGGFLNGIDRVVWSRNGKFALLHSSSGRQVQRVRLSQNEATADAPVDLAEGTVTTIAIDSTGRQIAIGIAEAGLYLLEAGQSPALLASMMQPAAATFDGDGRLYAADLATQRILEFQAGSGPIEFTSLADPDSPPLDPVGLAVSGDARFLLLADRATSALRIYDIHSRSLIKTVGIDFAPVQLDLLSPAPVFLLKGESDHQLLLLDARQDPSIYFVPAAQEATL